MNFSEWLKLWPVLLSILAGAGATVKLSADVDSLKEFEESTEEAVKVLPVIQHQVNELAKEADRSRDEQQKAMELLRETQQSVDRVLQMLMDPPSQRK